MKCYICGVITDNPMKGQLWDNTNVVYCGTCHQSLQDGLKVYRDRLISNRTEDNNKI